MRVSVFLGVSIDGFIAHEDGSLGFLDSFEAEDHGYFEFIRTVDLLIIGRETYETVLGFDVWPYEGKRVIVLTHRPIQAKRGETTHAGDLALLVKRLADEGVKHVYLDGGNAIRCGLAENLVDDLTISIVPRTIGAGRPLFGTGGSKTIAWKTTSTRTYASGLVQVRYERIA